MEILIVLASIVALMIAIKLAILSFDLLKGAYRKIKDALNLKNITYETVDYSKQAQHAFEYDNYGRKILKGVRYVPDFKPKSFDQDNEETIERGSGANSDFRLGQTFFNTKKSHVSRRKRKKIIFPRREDFKA